MRSPPIVQLTVAYGAGLWAGLVVLVPSRGLLLILGLAILSFTARLARSLAARALSLPPDAAAAVLLLGVIQGLVTTRTHTGDCVTRWEPGAQAAIVMIKDRPSRRGLTTATIAHARAGCGGEMLLRFDSAASARGGTRAIVSGMFRLPGVLRVNRVRELPGGRSWRYALRDAVGTRIERLYGPRAALVEALVTGRREDLDRSLQNDFAAAGLAHLLSISGLHVGIMAAWLVMVLKWFLPRRTVLLVSTLVSWFYVLVLGCPAPATRTVGFITLHAVARWRQRHPPPAVVLAVAVLLILAIDPEAVTSVGAWLSVAAVWGTGIATGLLNAVQRRSSLLQLIAASLGATLVTAPISAYAFGAVAPVGVLANLVAVPISGVAVPALFASLGVGWMAAGAGLALGAIEQTARFAAAIPGGHFTGEPGLRYALPWTLLLVAVLWAIHRRPAGTVVRRRLKWAAVMAGGLYGGVALLPLSARAPLEIDVLDVGQGDAIAIRTPHGRWVLIDAGPRTPVEDAGRSVVVPFFRQQGVRRLDLLISTHADADHLGGVPSLLRAMDADLILENGQAAGTGLFLEHLGVIDARGFSWRAARLGDTAVIDGVTLAVIHPAERWVATHQATNENSVVVRLSFGEFDAVFTGDAGLAAESALVSRVTPSEVLKVGHHGSAGATGPAWLRAVAPAVAVISVGRKNSYGHPAPTTLQRLAAAGIAVHRTDQEGTVTIGSDGRSFWIEPHRRVPFTERVRCLSRSWLPSSDSSWTRSACTAAPRASYPTFSTISHSPPRSSPGRSAPADFSTSSAPPATRTSRVRNSRSSTSSPTT